MPHLRIKDNRRKKDHSDKTKEGADKRPVRRNGTFYKAEADE